eukprot:gene15813-17777_t
MMSQFFVKASGSNNSKSGSLHSISSFLPSQQSQSNAAGTLNPANDVERATSIPSEGGTTLHSLRQKHLPIHKQRELLPIYRYRSAILYLLEKYQTLILLGETGCGKSTQLPLYCHEGGWTSNGSSIVCTQPRRLAAITVATRVAEEYGCSIGEQVGYGVRFDYKCSSLTKIKYYTDGILLRETLSDPLLSKYSIIIIDEAHQRSLNSDILLGLLKKVQKKRSQMNILNDFKIIITSATLDANLFKQFFELNQTDDSTLDTATILSVQGRQHPVDIFYLNEPCRNYVSKCLETLINIHTYEEWGDVLIFLPGSEEIDLLIRLFQEEVDKYHASQYYQSSKKGGGGGAGSGVDKSLDTLYILPLYSTLPQYLQVKVFESTPYHMRKVIVATNIAESSITIENVKYVIDSGFVKLNFFDVTSGVESLITCPVTKSNAMQRSGRAGRSQAGKCYRLMTEIAYDALQDYPLVEMQRSDLSFMILQLKSLGIKDLLHFDFLSPPSSALMIYALELLYNLQAINEKGDITLL